MVTKGNRIYTDYTIKVVIESYGFLSKFVLNSFAQVGLSGQYHQDVVLAVVVDVFGVE